MKSFSTIKNRTYFRKKIRNIFELVFIEELSFLSPVQAEGADRAELVTDGENRCGFDLRQFFEGVLHFSESVW